MDIRKKIEKLLDIYIKQNKTLINEYEKTKIKKSSYEELLELLNEDYNKLLINQELIIIFLNSIYDDDLYSEEFRYLITKNNQNTKEINDLISIIVKDYKNILEELQLLELKIEEEKILETSAKRAKMNIKYHKLLDEKNKDIENVIKILNNLKYSGIITNQESILLTNEINHYNELISVEKGNPTDIEIAKLSYDEIPNIINSGFQEHDIIEVSHKIKNKLDRYVNEIKLQIDNKKDQEIITILKSYQKEDLKDNNYNYVIVEILNSYLEELLTLYKLIQDEEIYNDKENRREVVKSYYETLSKYLTILNYYNKITEYIPEKSSNNNLIEEELEEKILIYSRSEVNITKAKIISDMSDIPYEYYETVYDLINRFKNGTLQPNEITVLKNHKSFSGHIELRYDQVRIIIKHIKDNIYNVLGVFAKKDDKDLPVYRIMTNRSTPNTSTEKSLLQQIELSKITENELKNLVQEKGRKGTR